MKKKNSFIALLLGVALFLSACGNTEQELLRESLHVEAEEDINYSDDEKLNLLIGSFSSYDLNELDIIDNGDYTYKINISIFRLCSIDGSGYYDDGNIYFTGIDPSGELISGYVELGEASSEVNLVFTDSTWEYLPNNTVFVFCR